MALRPEAEIIDAHNTLGAAIKAMRTLEMDGEFVNALEVALKVLCWTLQHSRGTSFAVDLMGLCEMLKPTEET